MRDYKGNELAVGDRVIPIAWGDGIRLVNSNSPATVVGFGRTKIRVRFDGWLYGGKFADFDAVPPTYLRKL